MSDEDRRDEARNWLGLLPDGMRPRRPKAIQRKEQLVELQAGSAPMTWTWDGVVAEEARRTREMASLGRLLAEDRDKDKLLRRRGRQLEHLYRMLWHRRRRWCGTAPDRNWTPDREHIRPDPSGLLLMSASIPGFEDWMESYVSQVAERVGLVASFCLRDPRPVMAPRDPASEGLRDRLDVDVRRHELLVVKTLTFERDELQRRNR